MLHGIHAENEQKMVIRIIHYILKRIVLLKNLILIYTLMDYDISSYRSGHGLL